MRNKVMSNTPRPRRSADFPKIITNHASRSCQRPLALPAPKGAGSTHASTHIIHICKHHKISSHHQMICQMILMTASAQGAASAHGRWQHHGPNNVQIKQTERLIQNYIHSLIIINRATVFCTYVHITLSSYKNPISLSGICYDLA